MTGLKQKVTSSSQCVHRDPRNLYYKKNLRNAYVAVLGGCFGQKRT